jgi:hypothetical protein
MCPAPDSHSNEEAVQPPALSDEHFAPIRDHDGYPYERTLFDYDPNVLANRVSNVPAGTGESVTITGIYDPDLAAVYSDSGRVSHIHSDGSEHDTIPGDGIYECLECGTLFKLPAL